MRLSLVDQLVCPECGDALHLSHQDESGDGAGTIDSGLLISACGQSFPVVDGIPRLLLDAGLNKRDGLRALDAGASEAQLEEFRELFRRTQQSFGRQWLHYEVQSPEEDRSTFAAKTGWELESLRGLKILDAGCGGGRYSCIAGTAGADVTSVDLSRAVEKTASLCAGIETVDVAQANLMQLPFREGTFDAIFSIGVLHHTPDTRAAFESLLRFLKPGGRIAIWLYPKWSPLREGANNFWRALTTRLPHAAVHAIAAVGAPIGGIRYRLYNSRWRLASRIAWQTEKLLPVFSNHPDRRQRICDTFDWMTPQYQWHHTDEEVRGWFEAAGLMDVRNLSETSELVHPGQGEGVNFSGRKPVAGDRPQ